MDAAVLRQIGHSLFVAELHDPLPGQTSTKKIFAGKKPDGFDEISMSWRIGSNLKQLGVNNRLNFAAPLAEAGPPAPRNRAATLGRSRGVDS
jgi:hypothetical protein